MAKVVLKETPTPKTAAETNTTAGNTAKQKADRETNDDLRVRTTGVDREDRGD
ncbi:MAG: hypothetical protein ACK4FA_00370 [Candidatus Paceibacteria bacterium]